jgi:hypothetical protein
MRLLSLVVQSSSRSPLQFGRLCLSFKSYVGIIYGATDGVGLLRILCVGQDALATTVTVLPTAHLCGEWCVGT